MNQTIRVYLADDHPIVRRGIVDLLETEPGISVVGEATDGEEAVAGTATLQPDVILMDLVMPNMDGITLIKEVRQNPGNRFMPIIMLTTESQPEKKQEGKSAGASGWIVKPFKPEQLLAVVRMVCPA